MRTVHVLLCALVLASACQRTAPVSAVSPLDAKTSSAEIDREAQLALGREVYEGRVGALACTLCHGPGGQGQPGVFPPLVGQAEHLGDCQDTATIILDGLSGKLVVDGVTYDGMMPAQRGLLDDVQVAAVASYVRQSWGNDYGFCTPEAVAAAR